MNGPQITLGDAGAPGAVAMEASRAVGSLMQHWQGQLAAATDAAAAAAAVEAVLCTLVCPPPQHAAPAAAGSSRGGSDDDDGSGPAPSTREGGTAALPPRLRELADASAAAYGWPPMRAAFFAHHFESWASAALTECSNNWAAATDGGGGGGGAARLRSAVEAALLEAPAHAALPALVGHLSTVAPARGSAAARVSAAASDVAAALLARRFAEPGSGGVAELVRFFDGQDEEEEGQQQDESGQAPQHQGQQQQRRQQQQRQVAAAAPDALRPRAEALAGALAAAADRAQHVGELPACLSPAAYAAHAAREALRAAAGLLQETEAHPAEPAAAAAGSADAYAERRGSHGQAGPRDGSDSAGPAGGCESGGGVAFAALVLQRLASRGHAAVVAGALLRACSGGGGGSGADGDGDGGGGGGAVAAQSAAAAAAEAEAAGLALAHLAESHPSGLERVIWQVLLQAAASGPSGPNAPAAAATAARGGPSPAAARRLLSPLLRARVPSVVFACSEKLLLRRAPPPPALELLLQLLRDCDGGGDGDGGGEGVGCGPGLLVEAALCVARSWGDPDTLNAVPLPQQAASSHALARALALLPAGALDGAAAGVVPSVLDGVSGHLASPLEALRRQGMRVGRAFSAALNPSKPPLFGDQADLQSLLPEEIWWRRGKDGGGAGGGSGVGKGPSGGGAGAFAAPADGGGRGALARLEAAAAAASDSDDEEGAGTGGGDDERGGPAAAAPAAAAGTAAASSPGGAAAAAAAAPPPPPASDAAAAADDDVASEASLEPYDLADDPEAEDWAGDGRITSLAPLAAALRNQDDVKGAEVLLRAAPDELPAYAPELARCLLHCRVPDWADREAEAAAAASAAASAAAAPAAAAPDARRRGAMAALLSLAPLPGGDALLAEVYSPHLDQYQRVLVLDTLCAAAREMADPRRAPRIAAPQRGGGGGAALEAGPRAAAPPAAAPAGGGAVVAPGMREASTLVRRPETLRRLRETSGPGGGGAAGGAGAPPSRTFRNRFSPVALRWASALLRSCDEPRHGVDLFGRDSLLLGRLLTTLGTFMECVDQAPAAAPLAAGVLELLRAPQVHAHPQVFVRRCALMAAAQVVSHLPPARLAGAAIGGRGDAVDAQLVDRLQWLQHWASGAAASEADEHCRLLAAGCVALQAQLSSEAMAAADLLPEADALDPSGLLFASTAGGRRRGGGGGGAGRGVDIRVPSLERLQLG
ncbi:hypothetical protein Rsub_08468 [Raphidocelis subcapitata]|uniref:TELO2 ARM repeat domain-containing protein n=1 Tax=Raphidocelis subcapitata TaxID=307507 RepID=A0A2V0PFA4_9CHLO|nr:hypothetical protein Rsub_08468 [Raphidocelis subcapitata]|eukprot:GBF95877.1 hypothetical protein Rsub_08468 [Raphidocelis subcapitata]